MVLNSGNAVGAHAAARGRTSSDTSARRNANNTKDEGTSKDDEVSDTALVTAAPAPPEWSASADVLNALKRNGPSLAADRAAPSTLVVAVSHELTCDATNVANSAAKRLWFDKSWAA